MSIRTHVHGYGGPTRWVRMTDTTVTNDRRSRVHLPWAKLGKIINIPKYHPINKLAEV